jgi:tetratricopeptide (TPR) repeat protein
MSTTEVAAAAGMMMGMMCCASCSRAEVDDVKLKKCNGGCGLVKYCSDVCRINHREQHEEECKERAAELRDRDLFTQPDESHLGECPICCLPLPINGGNVFMPCCSKRICKGCHYTNSKREFEAGLEQRCAFCREPVSKSDEEAEKHCMKRIKENNDPAAMNQMGNKHLIEGDHETSLEYLTKAAKLGDVEAHYNLSCFYRTGEGVEKDAEKEVYHLEEAAIGGHHKARHNLGCGEWNNERFERAKKHFIIAANLGYEKSLQALRQLYADGHATKEDYAGALRAYQTAVDETKSAERKVAEAYYAQRGGWQS